MSIENLLGEILFTAEDFIEEHSPNLEKDFFIVDMRETKAGVKYNIVDVYGNIVPLIYFARPGLYVEFSYNPIIGKEECNYVGHSLNDWRGVEGRAYRSVKSIHGKNRKDEKHAAMDKFRKDLIATDTPLPERIRFKFSPLIKESHKEVALGLENLLMDKYKPKYNKKKNRGLFLTYGERTKHLG